LFQSCKIGSGGGGGVTDITTDCCIVYNVVFVAVLIIFTVTVSDNEFGYVNVILL